MSATVETLSTSNQASHQETLTLRSVAPPPPPSADSVYIRPISAKEIRILAVHPGAPTDLLRCNFHIADLHDQRPDYETLSYTWGNEQPVMSITLGAQEYKVTRTVHSALLALRHPTELRWLWVDALCINQQDLIEKQVQFRQMGSIYSLCTHCNIWFGLIPEEFDEQTVRMAFDAIIWLSVPRPANTAPFYLHSKHIFEQFARVINAFMDHEWWYRIWTLQEVLLPTEKSFHWGPLSLDYKALDMLSELLLGDDYIAHAQWHIIASFLPLGCFNVIFCYMRSLKFTRDEDPLSVLWRWRFRRASNPLGKIYALVGINDGLLRIVPNSCDYSLSLRDLYMQVTVKLIDERGLKPLIGWCSEKRAPGLPSWVVDWYGCQEAPRDNRRRWNVWRHHDLWNISCASKFLKDLVSLSYNEQDLTLSMTGCFVDTVSVIVTEYDGEDREQRRCRWQKRLQEYLKLKVSVNRDGHSNPEPFLLMKLAYSHIRCLNLVQTSPTDMSSTESPCSSG